MCRAAWRPVSRRPASHRPSVAATGSPRTLWSAQVRRAYETFSWNFLQRAASALVSSPPPVTQHRLMLFVPACRPDLRCAHRLGHAEKDHHTLSAASSRQRLGRRGIATVDILPVVHGPHVTGGADCNIG